MILIRFLLVSLIVYLIVRSFTRYWEEDKHSAHMPEQKKQNKAAGKKVSKEIGEYIDYEEVDK